MSLKLNLGCGYRLKKGWINLDIIDMKGVDIIHDVNKLPLPFKKESFKYILCNDVLEHVNYIPLMSELYRILIKGGILRIKVPHFTSRSNYADPTHLNQFSTDTFKYFVNYNNFAYERDVKFYSKVFIRLELEKSKRFLLKSFFNFLYKWINISNVRQKAYERTFLRFFPTESLKVILVK